MKTITPLKLLPDLGSDRATVPGLGDGVVSLRPIVPQGARGVKSAGGGGR